MAMLFLLCLNADLGHFFARDRRERAKFFGGFGANENITLT